jgi:hypothetical protein
MNTKLISDDIWEHLLRLGQYSPKVVAISYISATPISLGKGDTIITDASARAITVVAPKNWTVQ